jgi:hypothetical protein
MTMWKMAKSIGTLPSKDLAISESDEKKLIFPLHVNITDIYLITADNRVMHIDDDRMIGLYDKRAEKGDKIIISFIPRILDNVFVNLVMEDIYCYDCTYINYGTYHFDGINISITTGGETPSYKPKAKYHVTMPWIEITAVEADTVYLSEAKYIT